jgi:ankyrin repeat protein
LDKWLSKGAPLTRKAALRTDLLIRAAGVGHVEATKVLLGKPGIRVLLELPLGPSNLAVSALHLAVFNGYSSIVSLLLDKPGIQIDRAMSEGGHVPLCIASLKGHVSVVNILLEAGADVEKADNGYTPLIAAVQELHSDIVKILLGAGADVEKTSKDGDTPLILAVQEVHSDIVNILLEAGADVDKGNQNAATPLYIAAQNGHNNIVNILLSAGADKNKAKYNGATPLFVASQHGHSNIVKTLLKAGAEKDMAMDDGHTPMYVAAEKGYGTIVTILLEAGADKYKRCAKGATPLTIALQLGQMHTADLLRNKAQVTPKGAPGTRYCSETFVAESVDVPLHACSKCKMTYYASREAQRRNWKFHKKMCAIPDTAKVDAMTPDELLVALEDSFLRGQMSADVLPLMRRVHHLLSLPEGDEGFEDHDSVGCRLHFRLSVWKADNESSRQFFTCLWSAPGMTTYLLNESLVKTQADKSIFQTQAHQFCYLLFNIFVGTALHANNTLMSMNDGIGSFRRWVLCFLYHTQSIQCAMHMLFYIYLIAHRTTLPLPDL